MIHEIQNGVDQHAATCVDMMGLPLNKANRTSAKGANFRMIYANPETSWFGYYMDPMMPAFSQKKWKKIVSSFFKKYNGLAAWHQDIIALVNHQGFYTGPTGRMWTFEKARDKHGIWGYDVGQIRNYMVQGTSGDVIKLALVYIRKRIRDLYPEVLFLMTVHDSLILDMPDGIVQPVAKLCIETFNEIPALLEKHFGWKITVPIDGEADAGHRWGELENVA